MRVTCLKDVFEENTQERKTLDRIVNNFYRSLVNKAKEQKWGAEMHTPLILKLFEVMEQIVPQILKQYDGEEKEGKLKGIAAQLRFSIEDVMDWDTFMKFTNAPELEEMSKLLKSKKEVDISLINGFLDNGRRDEKRERTSYIT